jgi:polyisoprenoid-binding protein YceI
MKSRPCFLIAAFILLLRFEQAEAGELYTFDQAASRIGFEIRHFLGNARGQFHHFSGTIDLDREHPERSSVSASIDVQSIDTGIAKRDTHLRR